MGSSSRTVRYDEDRSRSIRYDEDRGRRSRDSPYYREDDNGISESRHKTPLLHFTTDINPAIFSGPIPLSLSPPGTSRGPYTSGFRAAASSYTSASESSHDRKYRREAYSFEDEERRSRHRERYDREREYDRSRERDRSRGRERSRESRDRGRDRSYEREEERRERERERERLMTRDRDWREEIPNCTLMVRGLDTSVTENDIKEEVQRFGLTPKDIRLIREKGTGASRGFAFVEFQLLSEAVRWKELTKGRVIFGSSHASLHYSIPKDMLGADRYLLNKADWDCPKCGMSNFKRRDYCFKCNSAREDSYEYQQGDCYSEISNSPSNILLFGNLDVLTTEGRVLAMLGQLTTLPIKSLRVAKDSLTNTSRGYAFVELNSTSEAIQLYELLVSMGGNFYVDGRQVTVSYAKRNLASRNSAGNANAAIVALAAAQWTNQKADDGLDKNNSGATSSLSSTEKNKDYSVPNQSQMASLGTVTVNGATYYKYPQPDISTYQYEESSGYYYDPSTGLYYDANSQYYYNSESQQYMYWDGENQTYLPVSQTATTESAATVSQATISSPPTPATAVPATAAPTITAEEDPEKKKKEEKLDKVKIAKKIAKDMEKWAKTLNQKKENAKLGIVATPPVAPTPNVALNSDVFRYSATADAGFAILEKRVSLAERSALMAELDMKLNAPNNKPALVSYGDDTDSDTEQESTQPDLNNSRNSKVDESKYIDLSKMACLLCKRQFPNKDVLTRHQQLSDLHKKNLAKILANT